MAVVVGGILLLRLPAFLALLLGALTVALLTSPDVIVGYARAAGSSPDAARALADTSAPERIAQGFGRITGQIGIVIAMASIIGGCLLESGAAERIVRASLRLFGERRAGRAFLGSGFLLSIPVFFDTVFYLMVPLAKSLRVRTGRDYLLYVMAILAGGSMAHSLVPPTPGPLFVAAEFEVQIGVMILGGCAVGIVAALAGYAFAWWSNRRWDLPLREPSEAMQKLEDLARREGGELPSLGLSLIPILLPVLLIAGSATAASLGWVPGPDAGIVDRASHALLMLLGDKNMALMVGAAVAVGLLFASARTRTTPVIQSALTSAGMIILITGAGGAFGQVLQQTGIATEIERIATGTEMAVLPLAFLLTTLVRTAQGSATVAMITAAAAFQGLATPELLGFHPVYLALAIGCGSKPIMWMNDSGFWIITQMSGMTGPEGLRTLTPQLLVMGIAGLGAVMFGAWLFPLL
jgi:GntP family gluconate:H+ symporter